MIRPNVRLLPDEKLVSLSIEQYEETEFDQHWRQDVVGAVALMILGTVCLVLAFA